MKLNEIAEQDLSKLWELYESDCLTLGVRTSISSFVQWLRDENYIQDEN